MNPKFPPDTSILVGLAKLLAVGTVELADGELLLVGVELVEALGSVV